MCKVGTNCQKILDRTMKNLPCDHLEIDEIWTFVHKNEKRLNEKERRQRKDWGDQYVFIALDADTRLIPAFTVGRRDGMTTSLFISDLKRRLNNHRIQITTDGFKAYIDPIEVAWGADVDYAQFVKFYESQNPGPGRYSPPKVKEVVSTTINGDPDPKRVCTSYVERHNLTVRMQSRRFTRLTNGFSKKLENLKASLALYFFWYNFVRIHGSLRVTPAMEAGITSRIWSLEDVLPH
jgi:IS1 family transposase